MSDKKRVGTTASGEKSADGPSGIGKSTMLALALGMVEPAAGHVTAAFAGGVAIDAASLAPGAFCLRAAGQHAHERQRSRGGGHVRAGERR